MRVSRKPAKKSLESEKRDDIKSEGEISEDEDPEVLHDLVMRDLQVRNIQAQVASRQSEVSNNPGSNVKQIFVNSAQPRGLSH
ncbi:hypothetical protein INT48_000527 [Thamnidium elegans]|uniref:Uncharacterized protein n=1 Tax=Thamnidium elegans TaxID=101142 RepID=A0A8H7W1B8_9FUNG|nr:hypothetical protein INT48_000527 [Thamnidium elegans]